MNRTDFESVLRTVAVLVYPAQRRAVYQHIIVHAAATATFIAYDTKWNCHFQLLPLLLTFNFCHYCCLLMARRVIRPTIVEGRSGSVDLLVMPCPPTQPIHRTQSWKE